MSLKITGGSFKGRGLIVPRIPSLRPVTGRLKESLFALIGARIRGARVADLYAGVGSFGLEAMSRGAAAVTFVEQDVELIAALEQNLRQLGLSGCARVYAEDVLSYLEVTRPSSPYDIVFLDPPYGRGLVFRTVEKLASWPGFGKGSLGIAKTFKKERFAGPDSMVLLDDRVWGDDRLLFFGLGG